VMLLLLLVEMMAAVVVAVSYFRFQARCSWHMCRLAVAADTSAIMLLQLAKGMMLCRLSVRVALGICDGALAELYQSYFDLCNAPWLCSLCVNAMPILTLCGSWLGTRSHRQENHRRS
jgi:hypothetical protein